MLLPGHSMGLCGPNIGSILVTFHRELLSRSCILPAFAGTTPTCHVGIRPSQGTTGRIQLLGMAGMQDVGSIFEKLEARQNGVFCKYGRRGVAKAATAQTYAEATRSLDSHLFVVPPAPACDETPTTTDIDRWVAEASRTNAFGDPLSLKVCCVHNEGMNSTVCRNCISNAAERLYAVSHGGVALSLQEVLECRGHTAIFRQSDDTLKSETFKDYGRGEVETELAVLVDAHAVHGYSAAIMHPLFVAQDPNLFWPLVFSHVLLLNSLRLTWTGTSILARLRRYHIKFMLFRKVDCVRKVFLPSAEVQPASNLNATAAKMFSLRVGDASDDIAAARSVKKGLGASEA